MTNIIEVFVGDFLYVVFPDQEKSRRVRVIDIDDGDVLHCALYDRSEKKYVKELVELSWVTGVKLMSRKNIVNSTISAILVCEYS